MRDILFRGKTFNDEWVEGALVKWSKAHSIIRKYGSDTIGLYEYSVVPETVGQYTGLTDKNGKKIFEGDIIATPNYKGVVNYGIGCFCVEHGINNPAIDIVMNDFDVYVIGNIHDNPELLEVAE